MLHHKVIGTGRPILMLHGVTLDHRVMEAIMEPAFRGRAGWKRVYVDLPGHGQSPARGDIRSQDDVLAAVLAFATETFGETPFAVAGQSRGSYLARGLLHRLRDRIAGACLIVPGGNPGSDPSRLPDHVVLRPDPALGVELGVAEIWAHENMSVIQRRDIVEMRRAVVGPARALHSAEQEKRVVAAFEFSFADAEAAMVYERPSLIVAGRQDAFSGYLDAMELARRFTRSTLAVLDVAGHAMSFERPEIFHALVGDWLDRLGEEWPT